MLQETKLRDKQTINLKGYQGFYHHRFQGTIANGGVAILVREELCPKEIFLSTDIQAVACEINWKKKIILCSVYIQEKDNFTENQIINLVQQLGSDFIISGDFNAHSTLWGHPKSNKIGQILEKVLDSQDMVLGNNDDSTYIDARSGKMSILDLTFFSSSIGCEFVWEVYDDISLSDHLPIILEWLGIKEEIYDGPSRFNFQKANWPLFTELTEKIKLNENPSESIDKIVEVFFNSMKKVGKKSIPLSKPGKYRYNVPWWCPEIEKAVKERKKAYKRFKNNQDLHNFIELKRTSAKAQRLIKTKKQDCWAEFVEDITDKTPSSLVWNKVNRIKGGKTKTGIRKLTIGQNTILASDEIAEIMAQTFYENSASKNYTQSFQKIKNQLEENTSEIIDDENMGINGPFTMSELQKALQGAKGKSVGPDGVSYSMLKNLHFNAKIELLKLYNKIWAEKSFPNKWREAFVIPILKPDSVKDDPKSYRPIALTNVPCKVIEKMVKERLMWKIENDKLLSENQNGFRKGRSTSDNLLILERTISESFSRKKHTFVAFFDVKKAYDRVCRQLTLNQVQNWRIFGNMLAFMANFSKDRKFQVLNNGNISSSQIQENGVPQGSVLSVTCFLISMNGLEKFVIEKINFEFPAIEIIFLTYADDIAVAITGDPLENDGFLAMQRTIELVEEWLGKNGFELSINKTNVLHCCRKRTCNVGSFSIGGQRISLSDNAKFLGVHFDSKLLWGKHINECKKKGSKAINIIKALSHTKWGSNQKILLNLHKSLVLSKIEYGSEVYGLAAKTHLQKLDPIHYAGIRSAIGAFCTSPRESLLAESEMPDLEFRRNSKILNVGGKIAEKGRKSVLEVIMPLKKNKNTFGNKFCKLVESMDIRLNQIIQEQESKDTPPWAFQNLKVCTDLSIMKKSETSIEKFQKEALSLLVKFDYVLYTDGSKSENATGYAIVKENQVWLAKMDEIASVFSAEAKAILIACSKIEDKNKNIAIASDSLSTLFAIKNMKNTSWIVNKIRYFLFNNPHITLVWIPGHAGINGNDLADFHAKKATLRDTIDDNLISYLDLKRIIKVFEDKERNKRWRSVEENKLKEFKENVNGNRKYFTGKRAEDVFISRIRIGHTRLTHSYLMKKPSELPLCSQCGEFLTIRHIIIECNQYNAIRIKVLKNRSLSQIFTEDIEHTKLLIKFFDEIKLLSSI